MSDQDRLQVRAGMAGTVGAPTSLWLLHYGHTETEVDEDDRFGRVKDNMIAGPEQNASA
jgi:hypothetical protein